jgi:hypothetical protein
MSGAMSGALGCESAPSFFATRRKSKVLDLVGKRLYGTPPFPEVVTTKEAHMDHLMSLNDLQRMLGVSQSTARRWTKRHRIKPVYVMGCVRFWHSEVEAVLSAQRGVLR